MKYFKIIMDKDYSNGPKVKNWFGKINTLDIKYGFAYTFPERMLFFVDDNLRLTFPDIVIFPFLLVSDEVRRILGKYDKNIPFKNVVLLEFEHKKMKLYHLPFLEHFEVVRKDMEDKEKVYYLQVNDKEFRQKSIFQFVENGKTETIVRLDLIESLLRRGFSGFTIEPVIVRGI